MILSILLSAMMMLSSADNPVAFTLRNNSAKSIPLAIPGVMNPNLSPMSNSGVTLSIGQEIFFYPKGKKKALSNKELLLKVDESYEGKTLIVNDLIKERLKALEATDN